MALTQLDSTELQQSLGCGSDWASIVAGYLLEYPDSVSKLAFCKLFQVYADKVLHLHQWPRSREFALPYGTHRHPGEVSKAAQKQGRSLLKPEKNCT